jgi:GTPase SAR1 family protein
MKHPLEWFEKELGQVRDLLDQGSFFSLTPQEKEGLREETRSLERKLASIENRFLTVGLLGGTGVGKSTLMNALAGSKIASTSHRRPHTDQVLIYRHEDAPPLPALSGRHVPMREMTHASEVIRHLLLCDLPDFDSLLGEHRQHVLLFLEHLDLLIWVTSPEKYADGRFYEFLEMVPKAKQNFYFVLNKVDLIFQGETKETGYAQLEKLTESFLSHIKKSGLKEPLLYVLSAEKAPNAERTAPWNQFPSFRQLVFQQRDIKQITAIKADNIEAELQQILVAFEKEVTHLRKARRLLEESANELKVQRPEWIRTGREAIDIWLREHVSQDLIGHQDPSAVLVGPGYVIAPLMQAWEMRFKGDSRRPQGPSHFIPPDQIALPLKRRLEGLEDRLSRRILSENLPSSFRDRVREALNTSEAFRDLEERIAMTVARRVSEPYLPSFWTFRTRQRLIYLLLVGFFILAIVGEVAWRKIVEDPSISNAFNLILSGVHTLFSTRGLAALLSFALINLLLGFRFYRRYKSHVRRAGQVLLKSIQLELEGLWEKRLDGVLGGLEGLKKEIEDQIFTLSRLRERRKESETQPGGKGLKEPGRPSPETMKASPSS